MKQCRPWCVLLGMLVMCVAAPAQEWQWLSPRPCGNDLHDVVAFGPSRAFAFGNLGTVLSTTDRGQHWTMVPGIAGSDVYDAWFADSMHGWAVGGAAS